MQAQSGRVDVWSCYGTQAVGPFAHSLRMSPRADASNLKTAQLLNSFGVPGFPVAPRFHQCRASTAGRRSIAHSAGEKREEIPPTSSFVVRDSALDPLHSHPHGQAAAAPRKVLGRPPGLARGRLPLTRAFAATSPRWEID